MPFLDYGFSRLATWLDIHAKIGAGWERKAKTYGYSEEVRADWRGDRKLKISVTVLPRPSGFDQALRVFPECVESDGEQEGVRWSLRNARLEATVKIFKNPGEPNTDLPWRFVQGQKLGLVWKGNIGQVESCFLEMQLLLVFQPPPLRQPDDLKDWFGRFFPGGLPSLGRRR
jgi:hypothetical protein